QKIVASGRFSDKVSAQTEARTESRPPPDLCNTPGGGPPRETHVFRTVRGPADSIRGLRAESPAQPHSARAGSTRAPTHWQCHGGGTRHPPPCSQSPTRPRPPAHTQIRRAHLLPRPPEQFRYSPACCTVRKSNGLRPSPAAQWQEAPAHRSTEQSVWLRA